MNVTPRPALPPPTTPPHPHHRSTYDGNTEVASTNERKVLILGGGPNRIGQGIEFDYCCCHASFSLRKQVRARVWRRAGQGVRGMRG